MENKNLLVNTLATSGYITVNKLLIKLIGLNEAVILGELISEYKYWQENNLLINDAFYSTQENLEENTGLNPYFQRKAITSLKEIGLIKIEKTGMPAKNYYKLNFNKLVNFLTTSCATSEGQVVQPVNLNNNKEISNDVLFNNNTKKKNLFEKGKDIITNFTDDSELQQILIEWLELQLEMYRNENKQFYLATLKNRLNKLKNEFVKEDWKTVVQYALEKQWKSFYPLPTKGNYNVDVISQAYTKNELEALKTLEERRQLNGLKTKF